MTHATERPKRPGKLIAVEGLDGSGKSTQIFLLKRWLELGGYKVFFTEWNSSPVVKRSTKRGKKRRILSPTTFALIHCTDFADRYERQILPLLQAGYLVLADRYIYTAFARDAARDCDRGWIRQLYDFAAHPDLTFFFDAPLDVALGRILDGRPQLKYYEAGLDMGFAEDPYESFRAFQGRIHQEYQRLGDEYGFIRIDAGQPHERQQEDMRAIVRDRFELDRFKWEVSLELPRDLWKRER